MKAFVRVSTENQDVQLTEVPVPEVGANEVLIKVEAFGVGVHDRYYIPNDAQFPYVIGTEGAGIISKLGDQVNGFSEGERVIYSTALQPQGGTWAEFTVAKAESLIKMHDNLPFKKGAALPIAGKTALECMRELDL
ncbi:MAG TPA: alcohol dehydrogenase catalytic domain-containing protein [Brumimicrobium sp.]|nr:alcohol dehydrogenase catalytic domain-containing protein [Brumimicrobium sp.]